MTSSADRRAIVFIGPMGSGKTSVGKKVAKALGVGFADSDKAVIAAHGPIPRIFEEHGEAHFRVLEREAVADVLSRGGVVALGGGAVLDPVTRAALRDHLVVLLTVDAAVVRGRIGDGSRPLLGGEDPIAAWSRIAAERRPVYESVADIEFDTSHGPLQQIAERIAAWVREETA